MFERVLNTRLLSNYCCHCITVSSTALQLHISLGYSLLLNRLYKEKFEDIVGEGNNKQLTTSAHKMKEIFVNNDIENKDGLIVGYGLTVSSILAFDTNKDSQIFASNAHKELAKLIESTTKEDLSMLTTQAQFFSLSLITMYAYQAEHLTLEEVEKYFEMIEKKSLQQSGRYGTIYSRMESRPYPFKFCKGCLPQVLLNAFLKPLSNMIFVPILFQIKISHLMKKGHLYCVCPHSFVLMKLFSFH